MEAQLTKLRHIMPRYLATSIGVVVGVALSRWVIEVQGGIQLKEETWLIASFVVAAAAVFALLEPKHKILKSRSARARTAPFIFGCLAIALPAIFAVHHVPRISGDFVSVDTIADFDYTPGVRYVAINSTIIDVSAEGVHASDATTTQRGRPRNYNMQLNYVHPFVESPESGHSRFWRGRKFFRTMRAREPELEKEAAFRRLREYADAEMAKTGPWPKSYYEVVAVSHTLDRYKAAIASVAGSAVAEQAIVLELKTGRRPPSTWQAIEWTLQAYVVGIVVYLLIIATTRLKKKKKKRET